MLRLGNALLKCIGVRGQPDPLGVSETLESLQVAAAAGHLLEAAEPCMEYLEAIPWSDEEALQIKNVISSLQIQVNPNMHARLYACQSQYLKVMEIELKKMLSSLCAMRGSSQSLETTCYKILIANCGENCSKQLKDLTKSLVLQEARDMLTRSKNDSGYQVIESAKLLLWFIRTLRSMGVTEYVSVLGDVIGVFRTMNPDLNTKIEFMYVLDDAFKKMEKGKMIIQRKDRLKLVTNCMPIIQHLSDDIKQRNVGLCTSLRQGIQSAISTLPAEDYIQISRTWDRNLRDLNLRDLYSSPEYCYWIERLRSGCNRV